MSQFLQTLGRDKRRLTKRLQLAIALRHPPTAKWAAKNPNSKKRMAVPPGGLKVGPRGEER